VKWVAEIPNNGLVRVWASAVAAAAVAVATLGAVAQMSAPTLLTGANAGPVGETLELHVGRSAALRTDWNIKRVSVADPEVADVDALETNELLIVAKDPGQTDLIVWGEGGEVWSTQVVVSVDLDTLNEELREIFPNSTVNVVRTQGVYFARGMFADADQARQLSDFLVAAELNYVDQTTVAGLQQVMLKVRVAEVNRRAIRTMGVNALQTGTDFFGLSTPGTFNGGSPNQLSIAPPGGAAADASNLPFVFNESPTVSPFNSLILGFPGIDLQLFIDALAENQYLKTLAEPTLVALSGQSANFLAGGEFPIPVVQGTTTGGGTSISIEYREFGVRLNFTPTVLGDGRIRLHVRPEVSELSSLGSVQLSGFNVPSLVTRRAETVLELGSGQTFSMAGLLSQSVNARNSRIPFIGDIPVLGQLFRSVEYQRGETELVVLVTAELVEPMNHVARRPVPGDLHASPSDWELFGRGKIEGGVESLHGVSEDSVDLGKLEEIKGPGAWASYYDDEEANYNAAKTDEAEATVKLVEPETVEIIEPEEVAGD